MEADPWKDFLQFYIELASAIQSEIQSPELEAHLATVMKLNPKELRPLVKFVCDQFDGHSKAILFRLPEFFESKSLKIFQSVDFDLSEQWKARPMWRQSIWEWVERLFVIGNVCLHPNRKDKFLQAVRKLKMQQQQREVDDSLGHPDEEEDIQGVVDGMAQMFGLPPESPMNEFMSDLAVHMQQKMTQSDNPMALLQSMMNGDMSVLDDVNEKIQAKIEAKIESGELTEEDFQRQQEGMMQNFGGISGLMQMANGLGLQTDGAAEQLAQAEQQPDQAQTQQRIEQLRQIQSARAQQKPKKKSKGKKKKKR